MTKSTERIVIVSMTSVAATLLVYAVALRVVAAAAVLAKPLQSTAELLKLKPP
jgi:hypothetical protein